MHSPISTTRELNPFYYTLCKNQNHNTLILKQKITLTMTSTPDYLSSFQYHCLSSEESSNELIPHIIKLGKLIHQQWNDFIKECIIALSYGKRLVINSENSTLNDLKKEDIIEIIDVNPANNQVLYFGSAIPAKYTPLLHMIHYARNDIQVQLMITLKNDGAKHFRMFPVSLIDKEKTFMDLIKSVLTSLQTQDNVIIDEKNLIMTSPTIQKIETSIKKVGETNENTG